jgi:four helix bundle protein
MGVALKELVESRMWLRIIADKKYVNPEKLAPLMGELEELVKIFHSSIQTARRNMEGR